MIDHSPHDAIRQLMADPLRPEILESLEPMVCYLVGGAVRDQLALGRTATDWDLIVPGHAADSAKRLATDLGGRLVQMGADRFATFRVVLEGRVIDVCDQRGASLEAELLRRDLTINSIAVDLVSGTVHDPTGGRADMRARILRANAPERFSEDPIRVLRLVRHALDLMQFTIDPSTTDAARSSSSAFDTVPAERVRTELDKILGRQPRVRLSGLLLEHGLFPRLWGALETSASVTGSLATLDEADDRLIRVVEETGERPHALELVAMHHALILTAVASVAGSPADGGTSQRLLIDLVARGYASKATADLARPLLEPIQFPATEEERRLFVDRFGSLWPIAAVIGSLSESESADELERIVSLARADAESIGRLAPLLSGHDLAREFSIAAGPRMGQLLGSLRQAQVAGRVRTEEEAREWIRRQLGD